MTLMTRRMVGASAFALFFTASMAGAQEAQTIRIRGTIENVDGPKLAIKVRDGSSIQVKLGDNARITAMLKATVADIKQGSFIGVTAMPQPDGSQKAIGLHIFMDAQRGVVQARFIPWDREPGSTMTNADVESTVAGVDGQTMMVKYPDGEKKIIVPPNTPVVKFAPGSAEDLKPGAQMIIFAAQKMPDGSIVAPAINVGRAGAAPPKSETMRHVMSALPPKADIGTQACDVRFVPKADITRQNSFSSNKTPWKTRARAPPVGTKLWDFHSNSPSFGLVVAIDAGILAPFHQKRTSLSPRSMSALCQKQTHAPQQNDVISSAAPWRRSCHIPLRTGDAFLLLQRECGPNARGRRHPWLDKCCRG